MSLMSLKGTCAMCRGSGQLHCEAARDMTRKVKSFDVAALKQLLNKCADLPLNCEVLGWCSSVRFHQQEWLDLQ